MQSSAYCRAVAAVHTRCLRDMKYSLCSLNATKYIIKSYLKRERERESERERERVLKAELIPT